VKIMFKGRRTDLHDLADKHGIKYPTLFFRYRRGLRDDDLIAPVTSRGGIITYYIDGRPYRLTPNQMAKRNSNKISTNELQNRLDLGLTVDEALKIGRNYVTKFGEICYQFDDIDVSYYIPIGELKEQDINISVVTRGINQGYDIVELVPDGTTVFEESPEYDSMQNQRLAEIKRQEKIEEYKRAKYRENKPHLFDGTPQVHKFGEYAQYLADSYSFACSKVTENNHK